MIFKVSAAQTRAVAFRRALHVNQHSHGTSRRLPPTTRNDANISAPSAALAEGADLAVAAVYIAWCAKLFEFLAVIGVEGGNGSCIGHMDMGKPPGIASSCAWLIGQWTLGRQNRIMLRCRLHMFDIFERRLWGK
jgi:hypothetical protein